VKLEEALEHSPYAMHPGLHCYLAVARHPELGYVTVPCPHYSFSGQEHPHFPHESCLFKITVADQKMKTWLPARIVWKPYGEKRRPFPSLRRKPLY